MMCVLNWGSVVRSGRLVAVCEWGMKDIDQGRSIYPSIHPRHITPPHPPHLAIRVHPPGLHLLIPPTPIPLLPFLLRFVPPLHDPAHLVGPGDDALPVPHLYIGVCGGDVGLWLLVRESVD